MTDVLTTLFGQAEKPITSLRVELSNEILFVTLNRPKTRNAMSLEMVAELRALFKNIENNPDIRAVVIRGAQGHFCSGGDLKDMVHARAKASQTPDPDRNYINDPYYQLNRAYGLMLKEVNASPKIVIAVLDGAVMGGGLGLAVVADIALAHHKATLAMPETGLGVVPAQIIPFVTARIGERRIRKMALLGIKLTGQPVIDYGFADALFMDEADLQTQLQQLLEHITRCAPGANATTKRLIEKVDHTSLDQLLDEGAQAFAHAIRSPEGVEGTMAFVQKRLPEWAKQGPNPIKA